MWVEKTNSGKFRMVERYEDYLTGKERRVSVTFEKDTRPARKAAYDALLEKLKNAQKQQPKNDGLRLGDLAELYAAHIAEEFRPSTARSAKSIIAHVAECIGRDVLIERLNARDVRTRLAGSGKPPQTVNTYIKKYKAMMRWAYRAEYLKDISYLDRITPVKVPPNGKDVSEKYLEPEELRKLIESIDYEPYRLLVEFLVLTGLRFGEAAALDRADVDIDKKIISIAKTYDNRLHVCRVPKTAGSIREIHIQPELMRVIKRIRPAMLRQQMVYQYKDKGFLFCGKSGERILEEAFCRFLRHRGMKSIGRPVWPHMLRHTHASLLFASGLTMDAVSRRLGHASSAITREIYVHVTEQLKQRDNEALDRIKIM